MTTQLVPTDASTVIDRGVMRGADLKARLDMIVDLADHAMKENVDYGKVPGTDKPSLWQAGADKLCVAFQIAPKVRAVEPIDREHGERAYRVIVVGVHQQTGVELGEGAGECSSNEEKYRWRYSVHPNEWDATSEDLRRLKWKRDGSSIQQIRTNPADVANTVLKMAVKRAKIAMVLAVTGAAAIFTQDVEDLAEELREHVAEDGKAAPPKPAPKQPQRKSASKPLPAGAVLVSGVVDRVERVDGKPFKIFLKRNGVVFSTFDEALGKEARGFVGTDHVVRLQCTITEKDGRTYHNVVGIVVDEAPAADGLPLDPGAEG